MSYINNPGGGGGSGDSGITSFLIADTTRYVRKDGSDSNDGLTNNAAGAWLTISHASDEIAKINLRKYKLLLQIGDGTYVEFVTFGNLFQNLRTDGFDPTKEGSLNIQGNTSDASLVKIHAPASASPLFGLINFIGATVFSLRWCELDATDATTYCDLIYVTAGAQAQWGNLRAGTSPQNPGQGGCGWFECDDRGYFEITGDIEGIGTAAFAVAAGFESFCHLDPGPSLGGTATWTFTIDPMFSTAFAQPYASGRVVSDGPDYVNAGIVTGLQVYAFNMGFAFSSTDFPGSGYFLDPSSSYNGIFGTRQKAGVIVAGDLPADSSQVIHDSSNGTIALYANVAGVLKYFGRLNLSTNDITFPHDLFPHGVECVSAGYYSFAGRSYIDSPADGKLRALLAAGTSPAAWLSSIFVLPKATTPVTVAALDSGTLFTNEGATAQGVFNLPTAAANLTYTFVVQDADGIQVVANTGDTIRIAGSVSGSAGNIVNNTIGGTVTLVAINATEWIATAVNGTWTVT